MKSVICTLYEGHYHFGVAALINSLYSKGFKGDFYVGYRGDLPFWITSSEKSHSLQWQNSTTFAPAQDLQIHFLPVLTETHFTNYKPEFISQVWDIHKDKTNTSGIFYFDPDIVNKCNWSFYERWITYGIALVHEIVWNDMPSSHPKRYQWAKVANSYGLTIRNPLTSYFNAGLIGVHKDQMGFIQMWRELINFSESSFQFDKTKFSQSSNDSDLFSVGDQDLMDLTAMCTTEQLSEFGPEGMDFIGGGWLMSHATGSPKPWKVNYLKRWLSGHKPSIQAKEYWKNANGIIKCYPDSYLKRKAVSQKIAAFLGRFYSK